MCEAWQIVSFFPIVFLMGFMLGRINWRRS